MAPMQPSRALLHVSVYPANQSGESKYHRAPRRLKSIATKIPHHHHGQGHYPRLRRGHGESCRVWTYGMVRSSSVMDSNIFKVHTGWQIQIHPQLTRRRCPPFSSPSDNTTASTRCHPSGSGHYQSIKHPVISSCGAFAGCLDQRQTNTRMAASKIEKR